MTPEASYSVFHKDRRCGLCYLRQDGEKVTVLAPEYDDIQVAYTAQDLETLFPGKQQIMNKHAGWIMEDGFQAVAADGRCGLLRRGELFTGLAFKRIIKLTFRHYLCVNDDRFSIIFFNDCGYEEIYGGSFFFQGKEVLYEPPLGITRVLGLLSRHNKEEAVSLRELITPGSHNTFISQYSHFTAFVDDVDLEWAVQRKIMYDDFRTERLDIIYGAIAEAE